MEADVFEIRTKNVLLALSKVDKCPMCKRITIDYEMGIYAFESEDFFDKAEKKGKLIVNKVICRDCDTR